MRKAERYWKSKHSGAKSTLLFCEPTTPLLVSLDTQQKLTSGHSKSKKMAGKYLPVREIYHEGKERKRMLGKFSYSIFRKIQEDFGLKKIKVNNI